MNFAWQHMAYLRRWLGQGRATFIVVWGTWLTLFVMALVFAHRHALRMPSLDEWTHLADLLTGEKPLTLSQLWSQTNEHRLPLIHAIVLSLAWLTGGAFHVENFINVAILAGLAAVLIETARRVRGSLRVTDAFFAFALLNFSHLELFLIRLTLNHALSAVLMGLALAMIACQRGPLSVRRALLLGGLLFCLPLCGANGLPAVLMGAAWLVFGARAGESPESSPSSPADRPMARRFCHLAIAGVLLLLVGLYFVGYESQRHHPHPPDLASFLSTCGQVTAMGVLMGAFHSWPWTGALVPLLVLASLGLLGWAWWTRRMERVRVLGLACFLIATVGIVLGLSWGRAGLGPAGGGAPRYAVVTMPALLAVYLVWAAYGPRPLRRLVELGLLGLFALAYYPNWQCARQHADFFRMQDRAMRKAIRDGAPPSAVMPYGEWIFVPPRASASTAARMLALQRVGLGPFAELHQEPVWHETALSPASAEPQRMTWDGKGWVARAADPQLLFHLPAPQFVHAVRLRFVLPYREFPAGLFEVIWSQRDVPLSRRLRRAVYVVEADEQREQTLVVWVNQTIDQFRIDASVGPCRFDLREITLLRKRED